MAGDACDVGDNAADWISLVTGIEGCRIKYMAQTSKSRRLADHHKYADICLPEEEVIGIYLLYVLGEESI